MYFCSFSLKINIDALKKLAEDNFLEKSDRSDTGFQRRLTLALIPTVSDCVSRMFSPIISFTVSHISGFPSLASSFFSSHLLKSCPVHLSNLINS